jgi:pentapeptide repeat protein/TIR domain-containing protein
LIEIRHKQTGAVLHRLEIETLEGASLSGLSLSGADLSGANLAGADLFGAVCYHTDLRGANLTRANLKGAYLADTDLRDANLTDALMLVVSLDSADLSGANLANANLTGAYLAEARLTGANLSFTNLQSTHLTAARMAFTILADCPSLHEALGLDEVEHRGPSSIDLTTLRASAAALPEAFLQGIGLPKPAIDALRRLYARPVSPPTCVLVCARADAEFTHRLRDGLLARGVSCWEYCPDLGGGYHAQIAFIEAMKRRDRLVFVCSHDSLAQPDLLHLLETTLRREEETGAQKLFPVAVDDVLFSNTLPGLAGEKLAAGASHLDWLRRLRERPVPDFRGGTGESTFHAQIELLIDALQVP